MDGNKMPEPARTIPKALIATRFTTFVTLDVKAVEFELVIASACVKECRLTEHLCGSEEMSSTKKKEKG